MAVNTEGLREVVGMSVGPSEAEAFWTAFLRSLVRQGLRGVKLVISGSHEGLQGGDREGAEGFLAALRGCIVADQLREKLPKLAAIDGRSRSTKC